MDENALSKIVIGAAIEVHRHLGPGLLESVYVRCLAMELNLQGVQVETEVPQQVVYKGRVLDAGYRLDMLVERKLVVELKVLEKVMPVHEAQLLSYLLSCLDGRRRGPEARPGRMAPGVKSGSALVFDGVPGSGPVHTPSPRPSPPRCGGEGDGKTGRGAEPPRWAKRRSPLPPGEGQGEGIGTRVFPARVTLPTLTPSSRGEGIYALSQVNFNVPRLTEGVGRLVNDL